DSITVQKVRNRYRLLLFDGHCSHINLIFLDFCISQKINPYSLSPHATHQLQPLDICISSSHKQHFKRYEYRVSKKNFYEIPMIARRAFFIPSNIQSRFRNPGLIPID
ncbi:hypothetical protein C7212DRAFT_217366, partial [Tuber magnatum]